MIIAATGDVHSPHYYEEFLSALDRLTIRPELFLIAGDMIDRGRVEEYEKIYNILFGKIQCPIIVCFGNNEFAQLREDLRQRFKEIKFLDDEYTTLNIKGVDVGIIGSTGSLDIPTSWQRRNVPNIEAIYKRRMALIDSLLQRLLPIKLRILLIHYTPTYKTLEGENPAFYGKLGTFRLENTLITRSPDLVIHGHSHRGKRFVWVDKVPVFNVAFPLNREIVIIDTDTLKPGLTKFV